MRWHLAVAAALISAACNESLPGQCKNDADCITPSICYRGYCVAPESSPGDAGADAGTDAGADAGTDAGARSDLGTLCTDPSQCASGFCADGVCCNSACDDRSCQRCDETSVAGAGHCGFAKAGVDPDHECTPSTSVCSGKCSILKTSSACTGTSFGCAAQQQTLPVPSGQICSANAAVAVSSSDFCNAGSDCAEGKCQASRWWTSCDGAGACRASSDKADAFVEAVAAAPGRTLTAACAMDGTSPCSAQQHCQGQTQYAGLACDANQSCSVDVGKNGCCGCQGFGCDTTTFTCKTVCASSADCASGFTCANSQCVSIAGAGDNCTGTGQGSCASNLKCDNGACCATSGSGCCNATHSCAGGLACSSGFQCATSCTTNSSAGCADSNAYCSDGSHCVGRLAIGAACTNPGQCATGFCADGVCCDAACNDKACQRCDSASSASKGHCGWNVNNDDPDRECAGTTVACSGNCSLVTTTSACSGTGYGCSATQVLSSIPSGKVCQGGAAVPVSKTAYCAAANDCADGKCSATLWWTSCDGSGACRVSGDRTASYSETTYASAGASLTGTCAANGTALCTTAQHCTGQKQFQGYLCAGEGETCNVDANVIGCCNCGNYSCSATNFTCKTSCSSNADCSTNHCVTSVSGWQYTCQTGKAGSPCDVASTMSAKFGEDCDPNLTCTSAHLCRVIAGHGCSNDSDCGEDFHNYDGSRFQLKCKSAHYGNHIGVQVPCITGTSCCSD